MKIVHTSYVNVPDMSDPQAWLDKISFYSGVLEQLSKKYIVESIEKINYTGEIERNGVKYHFLPFKGKHHNFPAKLNRFIKSLKPDIVFVSGFMLPMPIIHLRMTLGKKVKIVVINRSEKPFKGIRKYLQRFADRSVNAYLFPSSEFGVEWVGNGNISRQEKIHEAMHGSSFFSPKDKTSARSSLNVSGSPVFLWVGRLNSNKDPATVVKAFIQFLQFMPSAKLYMIFQTNELLDEIKKMIYQNSHAQEAIILIGKIEHKDMESWYNAADFIISGSHYEGGGIAVCEAMSCGCIPVVTDIISFRKLTGPGKCGVLYRAGDANGLLNALKKTIEINIEKERQNVLQQFRNELSFEAIAAKVDKMIISLD